MIKFKQLFIPFFHLIVPELDYQRKEKNEHRKRRDN